MFIIRLPESNHQLLSTSANEIILDLITAHGVSHSHTCQNLREAVPVAALL